MADGEELRHARAVTLELEGQVQLGELREAAWSLGPAMVATVGDEDLWSALAEDSERVRALSDEERLALRVAVSRVAVSVGWPALLDGVRPNTGAGRIKPGVDVEVVALAEVAGRSVPVKVRAKIGYYLETRDLVEAMQSGPPVRTRVTRHRRQGAAVGDVLCVIRGGSAVGADDA